jgi:hypothetical protein
MCGKVRARSGSRELMLTAEGFWPVAPVWGRNEEERLFTFSLSLVPLETYYRLI